MAHLTIRIEEMEYRPDDRSLHILAIDAFNAIVTLEIKPVYPRQLAADLAFVAGNPNQTRPIDPDETDRTDDLDLVGARR